MGIFLVFVQKSKWDEFVLDIKIIQWLNNVASRQDTRKLSTIRCACLGVNLTTMDYILQLIRPMDTTTTMKNIYDIVLTKSSRFCLYEVLMTGYSLIPL